MFEVEKRVLDRQPVRDASVSMGGNNAYVLGCEPTGQRSSYCVCLHKLAARERDGELESYPTCDTAIGMSTCPALAMRAEEALQGRALYFLPRDELRKEMDAHWEQRRIETRQHWNPTPTKATVKRVAPTPAPAAPPKGEPVTSGGSYADALNAAISNKAQPNFIAMKPGESMSDYAKRVLEVSKTTFTKASA